MKGLVDINASQLVNVKFDLKIEERLDKAAKVYLRDVKVQNLKQALDCCVITWSAICI